VNTLPVRLNRIKDGYTDGARSLASRAVGVLVDSVVTPNQLTALGFAMNVAAAILVYREAWFAAGIVFLVGSLVDILDGALARSRGQATPFGAFIDSTTDRISEGFMLGAIALVLAGDGVEWGIAAVFAALIGSFLTSYTRARAEALGLDGKAGMAGRAERVIILGAVLLAAPWGALPWGMVLLATISAVTVAQRIMSVRKQLVAPRSAI